MREEPPPRLIGLLKRLDLATAGEVGRMAGRVRRLARDLPRFESVWVDALAQTGILTPFQAAEINAGRGDSLRIGPYALCASLGWPDYARCYRARRVQTGEHARLIVVQSGGGRIDGVLAGLEALAASPGKLGSRNLAPVTEVGIDGQRIWAASRWVDGRTAAEWIVHNGRFPPQAVLELARAMLPGLCELQRAGLCHGDVSTSGLVLTDAGGVVLLHPGVRGVLRPEEGYARADLRPEAYDYLAPERITEGTAPSIVGDVYSCGGVWWHMLCGRPPLSGGDGLSKLRAGQSGKILDVRRLAPEVPEPLASAISACLERDPRQRPQSMARLAEMLGPAAGRGKSANGRRMAPLRPAARGAMSRRRVRPRHRTRLWTAALAGCVATVAAINWFYWWGLNTTFRTNRWGTDSHHRQTAGGPSTVRQADSAASSGGTVVQDGSVVPAHYETDRPVSDPAVKGPADLVLGSDGPLEIDSLALQPGQRVRGRPGQRPAVLVPRAGLLVDQQDVRFEGIDFIYDHSLPAPGASDSPAAVVDLRSGRAEFRGCSFRSTRPMSAAAVSPLPAAIRWTHPARADDSALSLPSGRVRLSDCVLRGVWAAMDCRTAGALAVELTNTLHLGTGPLVRLDHCPKLDEPVLITLAQVTLRGGSGLLECDCRQVEDQPGEISIRSSRCVFAPGPASALLLFGGRESPDLLVGRVQWTGQGTLVTPEAVVAAWREADGRQQGLDDSRVSIAGVVRSRLGFSGVAESGPGASRIIRWQAPLRSPDPPGIDPAALPGGGGRGEFDKSRR